MTRTAKSNLASYSAYLKVQFLLLNNRHLMQSTLSMEWLCSKHLRDRLQRLENLQSSSFAGCCST